MPRSIKRAILARRDECFVFSWAPAVQQSIDIYRPQSPCTAANLPQRCAAVKWWDRRTDRRTLDSFIDLLRYYASGVNEAKSNEVTQLTLSQFLIKQSSSVEGLCCYLSQIFLTFFSSRSPWKKMRNADCCMYVDSPWQNTAFWANFLQRTCRKSLEQFTTKYCELFFIDNI